MRINFTILLSFFLLLSMSLKAQTVEQILPNVETALAQQHWEEASNLFRLAVDKDLYKSEKFFRDHVNLNCPARTEMIHQLGFYCKGCRDYDKAYMYYKELTELRPREVIYLSTLAELEMIEGKEGDARNTYEKILSLDNNNLAANIFMGNYYFFAADKEKKSLESEYKKLGSPTRMQYANYRNELSKLVASDFGKARTYLEKVIRLFPSVEAKNTLDKIKLVEDEAKK